MMDLSTSYLGLQLKNPIIVSSSGLTDSVEKIIRLEEAGAGAVVLKSLFEEQINHEITKALHRGAGLDYPEAIDYMKAYVRDNDIQKYLGLISEAKKKVKIPVIASINCFSASEWVDFAVQMQHAGADALELNVFVINTDKNSNVEDYDNVYLNILESVSKTVTIPIAIKLGSNFSNLVNMVNRLSVSGAKGVVLFNRFYEPDIDIDKLVIKPADVFSHPSDIQRSLRWVSIVSSKVKGIDVSASTGIHHGEAVIKQLLVGAKTAQICSVVYQKGPSVITEMLSEIESWMAAKYYKSVSDFRGLMGYDKIAEPYVFERSQFMKYFSSLD